MPEFIARHRKILTYVTGVVIGAATVLLGADAPIVLGLELVATGYGIWRVPNA